MAFIRGDANRTGGIDLTDAITVLDYLFAGVGELRCQDAADANDNGRVELTDAVYLLGYLFSGDGAAPPPPFPEPGVDPTEDGLTCEAGN